MVKDPDVDLRRLNWEFFAVVKGCCAPHFIAEPAPTLKRSTLWLMRQPGRIARAGGASLESDARRSPSFREFALRPGDRPFLEAAITPAWW